MTTVPHDEVRVTVGVDTHEDVHVAVALDQLGRRLGDRGKPGGIITTALARRANKIAFAMSATRPSTTRPSGNARRTD